MNMSSLQAASILVFQALVLVPAMAIAVARLYRTRTVLGEVIASERPARRLRPWLLGTPLALGLVSSS